ncbi:MAG: hypothetical protein ACAI44_05535 [Candidatus Sericytochromatia bacterium]
MSQLAEEGSQVVTLTRNAEDSYHFSILQSFEFKGERFLLARSDNFPGQIFIVEQLGDQMIPVVDEQKLAQLREHLDRIKSEMPAVTVADGEGIQHVFQIVRQLEHEGETYLLGLDVQSGTELFAFLTRGGELTPVTDEALLTRFLHSMQAQTSEAMTVRVQNADGENHDYTVVGQFEISGGLYVLAAPNDREDELVALRQDGDQLRLITDPTEQALVNAHLRDLGQG